MGCRFTLNLWTCYCLFGERACGCGFHHTKVIQSILAQGEPDNPVAIPNCNALYVVLISMIWLMKLSAKKCSWRCFGTKSVAQSTMPQTSLSHGHVWVSRRHINVKGPTLEIVTLDHISTEESPRCACVFQSIWWPRSDSETQGPRLMCGPCRKPLSTSGSLSDAEQSKWGKTCSFLCTCVCVYIYIYLLFIIILCIIFIYIRNNIYII